MDRRKQGQIYQLKITPSPFPLSFSKKNQKFCHISIVLTILGTILSPLLFRGYRNPGTLENLTGGQDGEKENDVLDGGKAS